MQEIEFTKEDEYCIRNFGYNEVKDYEDLKQLEDEKHLIVEELEYRLQQKENIIKEVREKAEMKIKGYKDIINTLIYSSVENKRYEISELKYRIGEQEELLEILDKGE